MSRLYLVVCALCVPIFFISGCGTQTSKNTWRAISEPYNKYINTPARLVLDPGIYLESYQVILSESITDVDYLLDQLQRAMDDSDRSPDEEWIKEMVAEFPWLGGIAIVDGQGKSIAHVPEFTLKEFNTGPLLEEDPRQRRTDLRAYVMESPMGPEIYLAKPVYIQDEQRAILIAHFDMRSLLAVAGKPENFVMRTTDMMLWPGVYDIRETPLIEADWKELGSGSGSGKIGNKFGEFYWIQTYFANISLFYALPTGGGYTIKREQLNVLKEAGAFTVNRNLP